MAGQVIKRAGITAVVVVGAIVAAGPAAAAAAAPAAHAATTARGGPSAAATSTPASRAVARLDSPALRRFVPWGRATAAGASAMMTPQARMAAAANALGFSGAELVGVSCTSRSQCTATGMASTRSGKNAEDPGRAVERHHVGRPVHAHPHLPHPARAAPWPAACPAPRPPPAWRTASRTARAACGCWARAGTGTPGPRSRTRPRWWPPIRRASPAPGPRTAWPWAAGCSGMTLAEHWNGRKWSAVTTKHDGDPDRGGLPRHRELHGRRHERWREGARRALEREGLVGPVRGQPAPAQRSGRRVLHSGEGLRRGRHGRLV